LDHGWKDLEKSTLTRNATKSGDASYYHKKSFFWDFSHHKNAPSTFYCTAFLHGKSSALSHNEEPDLYTIKISFFHEKEFRNYYRAQTTLLHNKIYATMSVGSVVG
jgi:hypothetical protein